MTLASSFNPSKVSFIKCLFISKSSTLGDSHFFSSLLLLIFWAFKKILLHYQKIPLFSMCSPYHNRVIFWWINQINKPIILSNCFFFFCNLIITPYPSIQSKYTMATETLERSNSQMQGISIKILVLKFIIEALSWNSKCLISKR